MGVVQHLVKRHGIGAEKHPASAILATKRGTGGSRAAEAIT